MPQTYDLIATANPAGTAAFSFSSIPQTYTDLLIIVNARVTSAWDIQAFQANGSGSGYAGTYLEGAGSGATGGTGTSEIAWRAGYIPGSDASNLQYSTDEYHIMNYTSTSHNKTLLTNARRGVYSSTTFGQVQFKIGYWANTSAITSLTCGTANGGTYATGTNIRLYGIKAA
jgi:hypothetical protein